MAEMSLGEVLQKIDKKYGQGLVRRASEYPPLPRVSTGIFPLDLAIGGGVPKGRFLLFLGYESSGKTTVAKKISAQFQTHCRKCLGGLESGVCPRCGEEGGPHRVAYVDVEGTFDSGWFERLGGNLDELLLVQPEYAEQAADISTALMRTGEVDLLVIDSIATMTPADEIVKSAEDAVVGRLAQVINRMLRVMGAATKHDADLGRRPTVILINQVRYKVGVMFGNPETLPGGAGQHFYASIRVKFANRPSEDITEDGKKEGKVVGKRIRFNVTKNKTSPPNREGSFVLYVEDSQELGRTGGEIDNIASILDEGSRLGVIERSKSWYRYGEHKWQGAFQAHEALTHDPALMEEVWRKCLEA